MEFKDIKASVMLNIDEIEMLKFLTSIIDLKGWEKETITLKKKIDEAYDSLKSLAELSKSEQK